MLREYMKFHEFNDTRSLISNRETIWRECNKFIETTIEYVFPLKKKKKKKGRGGKNSMYAHLWRL